jgi:hypothetical protein
MCKDLGGNLYECFGNCANGTIWGTGIYTGDSNPYTAAKQMGLVPGKFMKVPAPALTSYVSATVNGITSMEIMEAVTFWSSKYKLFANTLHLTCKK